jgi:small GTP-binding protein
MRLRFVVIGPSGVGKSAAVMQYTKSTFSPDHDITIGVDFMRKNIIVDNYKIELQIWDCAGLRAFKTITEIYFSKSAAALCVFDLNDHDSLIHVEEYILDAKLRCPSYAIVALVGNKKDLPRRVNLETAQELATKYDIPYFEVSSKTGENIENMFNEVTRLILQKIQSGEFNIEEKPITVELDTTPSKHCCLVQ